MHSVADPPADDGLPPPGPSLVSTEHLREHLADARWCVVDCRHDLLDPAAGARAFAQGHVPGAVHAHLDTDLAGPKTGGNGRHPLPDRAQLAATFGRWGVDAATRIVAYDASGGSLAARLWWLARWLGHRQVAVLDGGWQEWLKTTGLQSSEPARRVPTRFVASAPRVAQVDAATVLARLHDPAHLLVDARAPERYSGAQEPIDPVAGHIPGAVNRFWQANLDAAGRFKSPARLRAEFEALLAGRPATAVIAQCGSGVTGCHHLLALEVAGLPGAALYPGSWSEWVADPTRPVAAGGAPG
jgi:thiosulfate/3-mercaptopyruvate sulfurtransferase